MPFKEEVLKILKKNKIEGIELEIPPDAKLGDFALPCFTLAKEMKKAPNQIAEDLAKRIKPEGSIKEVKSVGPYVNFFIDKSDLAKDILTDIFKQKDKYGKHPDKGERVMIEFFHANTHKGVHIGHIRNISMGEALCRLLETAGTHVVRVNFQGDIGPHVAKCIWAFLNLGEKAPDTSKGVWLGKIYSIAHQKSEEDEKIAEEVKQINNKIYAKDPKLTKVWEQTRQWCLDDFEALYKEYGVKFDRLYFESETEEIGKEKVLELKEKGIAEESDGAIIVNLEKENLGVYVLLSSEGNALYSTKDIGLAHIKNEEYGDVDQSLHLVGAEQELYFKQLFRTLELMDNAFGKKSKHLSYGLVMLPEGKMSSRDGTMVLYEDLRQELLDRAKKGILERQEGLESDELLKRSKAVAFAALKFSMINRDFNKTITFDWDQAMDFEGETGPYLVYTHARACSILRKAEIKPSKDINFSLLKEPIEKDLIKLLGDYPGIIADAAMHYKPLSITRYLLDLCQTFNTFYHEHRINDTEDNLKKARLLLVDCTRQVIANALNILGITALEEM